MISPKTLASYEFKTMEDYYNYIIESRANGNTKQAGNLFQTLGREQRKEFLSYVADGLQNPHIIPFSAETIYDTQKICIAFIY